MISRVGALLTAKLEKPSGGKKVMDAIQFNLHDIRGIERLKRVKLVYRLDINEYQGVRSTQLMVEHLHAV